MALTLIDGMEDFSSMYVDSDAVGGGWTIGVGQGRTGNALSAGYNYEVMHRLGPTQTGDTFTVGFAWKIFETFAAGTTTPVFGFHSSSGDLIESQICITGNGSISVRRYGATDIGCNSAPGTIALGPTCPWYYIEAQVRIGNAPTGYAVLRVNGTQVASVTGADTLYTSASIDSAVWLDAIGSGGMLFDDFYLCTGSGGVADPFLGDIHIETLYPNGNGAANEWDGTDGNSVDNYLLVNESPVNTSNGVVSQTGGEQDLYTFTDLTSDGDILNVCHAVNIRKVDSGVRNVKFLSRRTTTMESSEFTPDQASAPPPLYWFNPVDPEDSGPWTPAKVNALQAGVEAQ